MKWFCKCYLLPSIAFQEITEAQEITGQSEVTKVLKEIAEEEIDEVDILMEDINDEIKDLQQSITSNFDKGIKEQPTFTVDNVTEKDELSKPFGEKIIVSF